MREKLAQLAWKYNLADGAVEEMAGLLRKLGAELPKAAKNILKRCRKKPDKQNFHHFSLVDFIMDYIRKGLIGVEKVVQLIINIDGIPISDTSLLTLWPILGMIVNGAIIFYYCSYQLYKSVIF